VTEPVIVRRDEHGISRRNIDSDALKVLYRLHEAGHTAYLVGGSVRDLLLGRRPKDFDIGTSAHPYQIKKLFRNCWIIGRRFRLAHIKFGPKTIEVATFRRVVEGAAAETGAPETEAVVVAASPTPPADSHPLHRDNTFGTPEEDAFRRDFTINGLFYDIGSLAVIDYVGGLADLERRVVRSIGDPNVRFVEDPVRMLRAAVMTARLGFDLDPLVSEAIAEHRALIATASAARLLEEYFKILRSGSAESTFGALGRLRLLELMTPELKSPPDAVWDALARLDRYRSRFPAAPADLTNAVLIGSLLQPLGMLRAGATNGRAREPHADRVHFGMLPIARRDVERLRQIVDLAPRLVTPGISPRAARSLPHRPAFPDTLTWLDVHGDAPDVLEQWRQAHRHRPAPHADDRHQPPADAQQPGDGRRRRRRRRRRRGRGGRGPQPGPGTGNV
jgi:poly(A) polymerase